MASSAIDPTTTPAWQALAALAEKVGQAHLRDLFAADPDRGSRYSATAGDLYVDYAKNRVTDEVFDLLVQLADEVGLTERSAAMFAGEHINPSEDRAVLHTALRLP